MRKGAVGPTPNAGSTTESGGDPSKDDNSLDALEVSEEDWEGANSSFMVGRPSIYDYICLRLVQRRHPLLRFHTSWSNDAKFKPSSRESRRSKND